MVELANDGVILDGIDGNGIGSACLDPCPEVWTPFCVDIDTGSII